MKSKYNSSTRRSQRKHVIDRKMLMKRFSFFLLILLFLVPVSCEQDEPGSATPSEPEPPAMLLEDIPELTVVEILENMQKHFAAEIDTVENYTLITDEQLEIYVAKRENESGKEIYLSAVKPQVRPGVPAWIRKGNVYELWNRSAFASITQFDSVATAFAYKGKAFVDGVPTYQVQVDRDKLISLGPEGQAIFDDPDTSGGAILDLFIDPGNWMIRQIQRHGEDLIQTIKWQQYFDFGGMVFPRQRVVTVEGESVGLDKEARAELEDNLAAMRNQLAGIESGLSNIPPETVDQVVTALRTDIERTERQLTELSEGMRREIVSITEVRVNRGVPVSIFDSF